MLVPEIQPAVAGAVKEVMAAAGGGGLGGISVGILTSFSAPEYINNIYLSSSGRGGRDGKGGPSGGNSGSGGANGSASGILMMP